MCRTFNRNVLRSQLEKCSKGYKQFFPQPIGGVDKTNPTHWRIYGHHYLCTSFKNKIKLQRFFVDVRRCSPNGAIWNPQDLILFLFHRCCHLGADAGQITTGRYHSWKWKRWLLSIVTSFPLEKEMKKVVEWKLTWYEVPVFGFYFKDMFVHFFGCFCSHFVRR